MGKLKRGIPWMLLLIVLVVGFIVGKSIWYSLKDTRAELAKQKAKMAELVRNDSLMHIYVDSLDLEILALQREEQRLANEREQLKLQLDALRTKYNQTMARIDTLWAASSVITELDNAFPHWQGQFWAATRADGIHGLIAPRFFGAEVVEIKDSLALKTAELSIKDSKIRNLEELSSIKDKKFELCTMKADSILTTYNHLLAEYKVLDDRYTELLKRKWFTLHLSPGNIVAAGAGLAAGYAIHGAIE